MNGWKKVKLGEICGCITDGTHQAPPKTADGIPFITISNIDAFNQIDFENTMYVPFDYYDKMDDKRKVHRNDILYSVVGTFGKAVFMQNDVQIVFQRHIALLRPDESKVEPRFLYYAMQSDKFYKQADAVAIGAAQRTITLSALRRMQVNIPSIQLQQHIVSVLSAYDNLIDNYRRQIKILEEAAQRLYKEWFVDLRFPGHEHTKIVGGVPEGWRWGKLEELVKINYGKDHKKAPLDGNIPVFGSGGLMRMCNKSLYSGESVLIPRKGSLNNIIYVNCAFWTVDTMFFTSMKTSHSALFIYFFLKRFDMYGMNIGAAVPSMTTKILDTLDILIPNKDTLCSFDNTAQTLYQTILKLQRLILLTQEARDRLLPKLMSGEIKV